MFLHDRVNNQYNSATTGPTDSVGFAWGFYTGGKVRSSPAVVDETVYIGSGDGRLYALDMITGEKEWTFETGAPVYSSPAVADGTVYVGSNDHSVYAVDAQTGTKAWEFETGDAVRSSPTVAETIYSSIDKLLAIGSDDGILYLLNAATGEQRDQQSLGGAVVSTPTLFRGVNGPGLNYTVGSTNERSNHGAAEEGSEYYNGRHWSGPIYSSFTMPLREHALNLADIFTLVGTDAGKLHRWTEQNAWEFQTDGKVRSSPALAEGVVYFGSWDHNVYALEFESGEEQWAFETGGRVESSPAVADGVAYVGSGDQHVYALDAESGEPLWAVRTGGAVYSSPAVVNGSVFVGSDDGSVYALTACQ